MISGVWGKKIGMTQVFDGDRVKPVTVINVGSWLLTNIRTIERDGYNAIQVGLVKSKYADQSFSEEWLKSLKKYFSFVREIRVTDAIQDLSMGQSVDFNTLLSKGDKVDVFGRTKGCGFAGVVKRHDFAGARASHGSTMGKRPGSIGGARRQGKVIKGKKMPGQMGNVNRVMQGLEVVQLHDEPKAVLVKGSIPGKAGSLVFIRKVLI